MTSGSGFHLTESGQWKPEKIPPEVLKEAKFSGYLTIMGYRSTVFNTPDGSSWAQKSTGTLASKAEAISSITCLACKNYAWQPSLEPIQDKRIGGLHHPACPSIIPTTGVSLAEHWLQGHGVKPPPSQKSMRGLVISRVASQIASRWIQEFVASRIASRWLCAEEAAYKFSPSSDPPDPQNYLIRIGKNESSLPGRGTVASRIAARWLRAERDITTLVQKKLDRDGDDKEYDKAIVDFVSKARNVLPPIDTAMAKAADLLFKTREKIEHKHPKVQDRYVQMFLQELAAKHRELEDMRKQLLRGLTVELDRYEAEANVIE